MNALALAGMSRDVRFLSFLLSQHDKIELLRSNSFIVYFKWKRTVTAEKFERRARARAHRTALMLPCVHRAHTGKVPVIYGAVPHSLLSAYFTGNVYEQKPTDAIIDTSIFIAPGDRLHS